MNLYYKKYLKYKEKYNLLKNQFGGIRFIINGKEMDEEHLQERLSDGFVYMGIRDGQIYNQIQNFIENEHYSEIAPELDEEYDSEVGLEVDSDSEFETDDQFEQKKIREELYTNISGVINNAIYLFTSNDEFETNKQKYNHAFQMCIESDKKYNETQDRLKKPFITKLLQQIGITQNNEAHRLHLLNINNLNTIIQKIKLIDITNKIQELQNRRDRPINFSELGKLVSAELNIKEELYRLSSEQTELEKK